MSMTLTLWKAPVPRDVDDAQALVDPYYDREDDSAFEPSGDLALVLDQLLLAFPFDAEQGSDPWADGPENTGRVLTLSIRWGGDGRILADITALARKHGLVLYDPQGPDVFLPDDPIETLTERPVPTAWEWFKACAIAAVLVALTYAAWLIPVWWLRWPATLVAGFLAAAAVFVVGAMIFGRRILESDAQRR